MKLSMILLWKGTSAPVPPFERTRDNAPFSGFPGDRTDAGLCEPLWSIHLNCQLMTKLEMMHIFQAQACGCISAHPGLSHQKTKRETSDDQKVC